MNTKNIKWYYGDAELSHAITYKLKTAFFGVTIRTLCPAHQKELLIEKKIGPEIPREVRVFFCLENYNPPCELCTKKNLNSLSKIPEKSIDKSTIN